jgi:hypothetical protein
MFTVSEVLAASIIRAMMEALVTLLMEAAKTSETLVEFYQTTGRCNPEDSHLSDYIVCEYIVVMIILFVIILFVQILY